MNTQIGFVNRGKEEERRRCSGNKRSGRGELGPLSVRAGCPNQQPNWMCYRLVSGSQPTTTGVFHVPSDRCSVAVSLTDATHAGTVTDRPPMVSNLLHRVCVAALPAQVLAVAPCVHSSRLLEHFQWHIDHERSTKLSHFQASDRGPVESLLKVCSPLVVSQFGVHFANSSSRLTSTSVDILPSIFNVGSQPLETFAHRRCKMSAQCHALGVQ